MIWHAADFFHIHIHCKIISRIAYIFFSNCTQVSLRRHFVCMLHTSNRERWSHLVYAKDEDELEEAELGFFDAEAAPLSTFASLTSWGAGMPIGELSWSIAALWSAMAQRFAGAKPFSLIVNSEQHVFSKPYNKNNSFRFAKHAKRMFQPMNWHQPLQSSTLHLTINPQAEPRALMRPEPPEDLKRKPRPIFVERKWECWMLYFLGAFWGRNFHFGGSFWGRDLYQKPMQQILMKPRDPKCLTFTVSERHDLFRVLLQGAHAEVIIAWLVFCGWRRWLCCLCPHSLCQVEIPEIEFSIRPKAERRVDTIYNLILGCKDLGNIGRLGMDAISLGPV